MSLSARLEPHLTLGVGHGDRAPDARSAHLTSDFAFSRAAAGRMRLSMACSVRVMRAAGQAKTVHTVEHKG